MPRCDFVFCMICTAATLASISLLYNGEKYMQDTEYSLFSKERTPCYTLRVTHLYTGITETHSVTGAPGHPEICVDCEL